jgi:hypothetical protein
VPSLRNFEPPGSVKRLSLGRRAMLARKIPTCSPLKCARRSKSVVLSNLRCDFVSDRADQICLRQTEDPI